MHNPAILYPLFALAFLTFAILTLIPILRFRAAGKREVTVGDFRFGESAAVPGYVALPNRNYMNLLELPVLFYAVCLIAYASDIASPAMVTLAWTFVGLRALHSVVHLSYNNVMHRLALFVLSVLVLLAMWINALVTLSALPTISV